MSDSIHQYSLAEIANLVEGQLVGDPHLHISKLASLPQADAHAISFLSDESYLPLLNDAQAACVIIKPEHASLWSRAKIIVNDPYLAFAKVATLFAKKQAPAGIHPSASIAPSAQVGESVSIGAQVAIGERVVIGAHVTIEAGAVVQDDCVLGDHTVIHANVTLYHDVKVGKHVIIHSGAVIGADGFGMARDKNGAWLKIPQLGTVVIHDHVEIGANTTVDRGALDNTILGEGVKLDNQIQIAHNVQIGAHTAIAACAAIAGSTKIGAQCMIGGGACIQGHIEIADGVIITAMSGVSNTIKEPGIYSSGMPVLPREKWRKNIIRLKHLDELARRVKSLEKAHEST